MTKHKHPTGPGEPSKRSPAASGDQDQSRAAAGQDHSTPAGVTQNAAPAWRVVTTEPVGQVLAKAWREIEGAEDWVPVQVLEIQSYREPLEAHSPESDFAPRYVVVGEGSPLRCLCTGAPARIEGDGRGFILELAFRTWHVGRHYAVDSRGNTWPIQGIRNALIGIPVRRPDAKRPQHRGYRRRR